MKFVFIGMGGTNSLALRPFLMYLNSLDLPDKEVIIIDGDSYERSNLERQDFNPSFISVNKATAKAEEFKHVFPAISISGESRYLDESNLDYYIEEGSVVMMAVDCLKTRKLVDNYAQTLKNILVVSMGNELSDGDVHFICKVNNKLVTPSIQDDHPEISEAHNKTRSEMSCEEIAAMPSGGQLVFANLQAATAGVSAMWKILDSTKFLTQDATIEHRGAYFDVPSLKMRPVTNHLN